jgi:acyl-CoA thioester hydrolase
MPVTYRHVIRPRYGEIDMQGVVFNAHYFAYCDDACDSWMRSLFGSFEEAGWDFMLKRAEVVWDGAARLGDVLDIDVATVRLGTTSFDVRFVGTVAGRAVFTASITYVCVEPGGTATPMRLPDEVKTGLRSEG